MARKPNAPHSGVEAVLEGSTLPYTVFQPLYIYGAYTNKDCEQWFLDRIVRGRPVPIPAPGVQLVTLSHVDDLAAAMAAVVGNDGAITLVGIVNTLAKAAGVEAEVVLYDPKSVELEKGEGFPFRTGHFFASAEKTKKVLNWKPEHTFLGDAAERVAAYRASGRDKKDIKFTGDDKILAAVKKVAAVAA
jgi:nucleoside-diphosphate-sugar epimerase